MFKGEKKSPSKNSVGVESLCLVLEVATVFLAQG